MVAELRTRRLVHVFVRNGQIIEVLTESLNLYGPNAAL